LRAWKRNSKLGKQLDELTIRALLCLLSHNPQPNVSSASLDLLSPHRCLQLSNVCAKFAVVSADVAHHVG
jgi:hypothetical protein